MHIEGIVLHLVLLAIHLDGQILSIGVVIQKLLLKELL